jgi:hypothetical protein
VAHEVVELASGRAIRPYGDDPSREPDAEFVDRLRELADLRTSGDLSAEEFEVAKREALRLPAASDWQTSLKSRRRKRWIALSVGVVLVGMAIAASAFVVLRPDKQQLSVEGTFSISNGSYDPSNEFDDPNFSSDGAGGCEGDSGYGDLNSITQVVVTDNKGKEADRTQLDSGRKDYGDCVFTFDFVVPKGPRFFVVSVGDRGSSQYTYEELKVPGAILLGIGDD